MVSLLTTITLAIFTKLFTIHLAREFSRFTGRADTAMDTASPTVIYSRQSLLTLHNEAQRQSEYFTRTGRLDVALDWTHIAVLAHLALMRSGSIRLILCEYPQETSIHKPCE